MALLEGFIASYGVLVVFIGAAVEGETMVVLAGFLAHQGVLDVRAVAIAAFEGSFLGDETLFWVGRRFSRSRFVERQRRRPVFAVALARVEAHPVAFILAFRFLYGLRTVAPLAIGASAVSARLFVALNAVSAAVWAVLITAVGWTFGRTAELALGRMDAVEHKLLAGFAAGVVVSVAVYLIVRRLHRHTG
jgi:membrane protein DedA with SNARE-associated domain